MRWDVRCSRCKRTIPGYFYLSQDGTPILFCGRHKWLIRNPEYNAKPLSEIDEKLWLKWEQVHHPSQLPKDVIMAYKPEERGGGE